ncbi:MAG: YihY/virulence factor BrkB family protein [Oscillospiraceae bacterium]|nr:YihY/virulence factor BrkB family protein [Oscillospiraceae bacterium]
MKRFFYRAKQISRLYRDCHIGAYSAQAAFFVVVSVVPLAMLFVMVAGVLLSSQDVGGVLSQVFSGQAIRQVAGLLAQAGQYTTFPLVSVTTIFLVWSATRGVRSIAQGINVIYGGKVSQLRLAAGAVLYTVVLAAGVAVTAVVTAKVILHRAVVFVFAVVMCTFAYTIFSPKRYGFVSQLAGGVLSAAGCTVFTAGYMVYVRHFSAYPVIYGGFGAVVLWLLWLYICSCIVLCGALFNRLIQDKGKRNAG